MSITSLFLVPFAGGNVYSYSRILKCLPKEFELIPIELPGRGSRIREKLLVNMTTASEDIFDQIRKYNRPKYSIYGHSMGGLLAYLAVRKILANNLAKPKHLLVSGIKAPTKTCDDPKINHLPKDEFFRNLKELGGSPDEIFSDLRLWEFFEPILRSDFSVIESYEHKPITPLDIPITVISGKNEDFSQQDMNAWQLETNLPVDYFQVDGGHFFIFDKPEEVAEIIAEKLIRSK